LLRRSGISIDATFNRSAASFDNPDHVAIVIHKLSVAASHWLTASRNMPIWTNGLQQARS